jgi:hypothetical protein
MTEMPDSATLGEAREALRGVVFEGAKCPCCTQFAKVYKRKINSTMARTLITLYRHGKAGEYLHAPSLPGDTHEVSQLVWWGLVEEERTRREDGGRAGWWRVTDLGRAFVLGALRLPKHALIYDSALLRLDNSEYASIEDALGSRFDLAELMSA